VVSTIAGSTSGLSGDGSKATSAQLNTPYGIYADKYNLIYIADAGNFRIRKVNITSDIITTFAGSTSGNGLGGGTATNAQFNTPRSIAKDTSGNFYVIDSQNNDVKKITPSNIISSFITSTTSK
jgi:hypothetical protein